MRFLDPSFGISMSAISLNRPVKRNSEFGSPQTQDRHGSFDTNRRWSKLGDLARDVRQRSAGEFEKQTEFSIDGLINVAVDLKFRVRPERKAGAILQDHSDAAVLGSSQTIVRQQVSTLLDRDGVLATKNQGASMQRLHGANKGFLSPDRPYQGGEIKKRYHFQRRPNIQLKTSIC
jgi:hypothetical protein